MNKVKITHDKGYRITKTGGILNPKGEPLKGATSVYVHIGVRIGGKRKKCKVHRLQAYQKFGDKMFEDGVVVRHLDGNPLNNSWDNIAIGTHSDNMMDMSKEVRLAKALHATSFVRKHDKTAVYEFYQKCRSYKKTMAEFNISSKGTLNFIIKSREKEVLQAQA